MLAEFDEDTNNISRNDLFVGLTFGHSWFRVEIQFVIVAKE